MIYLCFRWYLEGKKEDVLVQAFDNRSAAVAYCDWADESFKDSKHYIIEKVLLKDWA